MWCVGDTGTRLVHDQITRVRFVSLVEAARQSPVLLKPTKIIKKSRGYSIDYDKKGLYCGYMDANLGLTGVRDRPQPVEIENGVSNPLSRAPQYAHFDRLLSRFGVEFAKVSLLNDRR